jgi:hypothetical protein
MSNKTIWSFLALAAVGVAANSPASADSAFLALGANPLGPEFIITAGPGGTFSTALNPAYGGSDPGPYDSVEDTYFGVINNTGAVLPSIGLSAPGLNAFGFDGDGINASLSLLNNSNDTSNGGYGGPDAFFTGTCVDTCTVVFGSGISIGGTDIFSLEERLALNTVVVTNGVPEASTWAMMILGFLGLGFLAKRKGMVGSQQQTA